MKKLLLIIFLAFIFSPVYSQTGAAVRDTSVNAFLIHLNYVPQLSGGDLADRFGYHTSFGIGSSYKSHSNWVFGAELNAIFGGNVREDGVLDSIAAETGLLINIHGHFELIEFQQRGFSAFVKAGRLFPLRFSNANSGIQATIGAGFLQHRIHFNYGSEELYQLQGEYVKGYDRLTNGFALQQSIGYLHLANNTPLNFFIGIDVTEGFTQNRRPWNFDTRERDDRSRLDLAFGLRASLIIPVFEREPNREYTF